uniref:ORF3 n=1 Tax=Stang virus TaxID=2800943 RepID=A0A894KJN2_9RHAB|nr:MAG: ORF3 [Stang virus]
MSENHLSMTLAEVAERKHDVRVHEGEGARVGEEEYARLVGNVTCHVTRAVELDNPGPYLKLIACLIFTESLYPSSVSYKVIQTFSTGLYQKLKAPNRSTPNSAGGSARISVEFKFYTRTPCIKTQDLRLIGGAATRCFSIIGNSGRCGFIEYQFTAVFRHLRSSEIGSVEKEYYICAENYLSDPKCNSVMERIIAIRKQFNTFRLSDYLGLLKYAHKGKQFGRHQSFPAGWLESSLDEPAPVAGNVPLSGGRKLINALKAKVGKTNGR